MTETKLAEFAKGDKVTSQDGVKLIVVNQGSPGGAVLAESAPGVKPYTSTFYAADSLKTGHGRATKKEDAPAPPAAEAYVVTLKRAAGESYTLDLEAVDEEAAVALAVEKADDADELVSVEKAGA